MRWAEFLRKSCFCVAALLFSFNLPSLAAAKTHSLDALSKAPYDTSEWTVDYLEPTAFSEERLEEGKKAFQSKCSSCHTPSGRDMAYFGNPDFNSTRVIGSVKKFAGALGDPELGEKVYEYLRYYNPGPFTSQHTPLMQPGPLSLGPGSANPILTDDCDFWGALTGHKTPTPEDLELSRIWDSYEWKHIVVPFPVVSWSEYLPHSVRLVEPYDETMELIESQHFDFSQLPLQDRGLGPVVNNGFRPIYDKYRLGRITDNIENMNALSYLTSLAILEFEYGLPQWVNGKWNREWRFGPYEDPILWKTGGVLGDSIMYSINPDETIYSRSRRRNQWSHYSTMFASGKKGVFLPRADFVTATMKWKCRIDDIGKHGGYNVKFFTELKYLAEMWHHSQKYPDAQYDNIGNIPDYGDETRRHLFTLFTTGFKELDNYEVKDKALLNVFIELIYTEWKAAIGVSDEELRLFYLSNGKTKKVRERDKVRYETLVLTLAKLWDHITPREQNFIKAYIRRIYPVSPLNFKVPFEPIKWDLVENYTKRPVILPFGNKTAVVGVPYRLRILRAQAASGDVTISAENLPPGANLLKSQGNWRRDDYDYSLDWTPGPSSSGKSFEIELIGKSSTGTDRVTVIINVASLAPAPKLDAIPDKQVYVGQELTFPVTVDNTYTGGLEINFNGDMGKFMMNSWQTAGLYSVTPTASEIGEHLVEFEATDSIGRKSETTAKIIVKPNSPPLISVSPIGTGPGTNKNIYYFKAGEVVRLTLGVSDPDGDPVELSKNIEMPGYIYGNEYVYKVEDSVAENFPGPNVLTFTVHDLNENVVDPRKETLKFKGGVAYKVLLIYFEKSGVSVNHSPWAVAGEHRIVKPGDTVVLDGSLSDDPDGDPITYRWRQISGPAVQLSETDSVQTQFTAPLVTRDRVMKFYLTVKDPGGLTDRAVVRVKVSP